MDTPGPIEVGVATAAEAHAVLTMADHAFSATPSAPPAEVEPPEAPGHADVLAVRAGGRLAGGLALLPMGQWFGGRSVPLLGVTGVVIAPDRRGVGLGARLMREALDRARASGCPLSALHTTSPGFYRRLGYEDAGVLVRYRAPIHALPKGDRGLAVRPLEMGETDLVRDIYARRARRTAGNLDRSPAIWREALAGGIVHRYVVERDGAPDGYVIYDQGQPPGASERRLVARDLGALSPAAGRRLLAFLADHRTTADQVIWAGPPAESLLLHLPTSAVSVIRYQPWLLRLVDVRAALEARGYSDGAASELHLDVHDDALPWNQGRLVLEVEGGRATARPGGAGRLRIGVRALAAVYSGHLPPVELRGAGGIEGDDDDLARLGAVFAGPAPWMPDHF